MNSEELKEGERAIIIDHSCSPAQRDYFLTYGITVGSVFIKNYSPSYADLVNITVGGKMLSIRTSDFKSLEWTRI